jgi:ADP-heptose:LPS heptosyltransferase
MATPVIPALRARYPSAQIDFLCAHPALPLLELNSKLSRIYALRWRNVPYWLSSEKRNLVRRIGEADYDFAVLLESAPRYRKLLDRAGITNLRDFRRTPFDARLHSAANNLRAAGFGSWEDFSLAAELPLSREDYREAKGLLSKLASPLVGLHAGYGPASRKEGQGSRLKGWSLDHFRNLARSLQMRGASIVLTGSRQDWRLNESIIEGLPGDGIRNLAGQTSVRTLAAAMTRMDLLISVDSGPAHMAAAVGCALVVLWGPAKLQQVRPIEGSAPVVVIRRDVPCAPCYDTPAMKACRDNICMKKITPQEVFETAEKLLSNRR